MLTRPHPEVLHPRSLSLATPTASEGLWACLNRNLAQPSAIQQVTYVSPIVQLERGWYMDLHNDRDNLELAD